MSESSSENSALACTRWYALIRGSPPVFAPVVTQFVTQSLTCCPVTKHYGKRWAEFARA